MITPLNFIQAIYNDKAAIRTTDADADADADAEEEEEEHGRTNVGNTIPWMDLQVKRQERKSKQWSKMDRNVPKTGCV